MMPSKNSKLVFVNKTSWFFSTLESLPSISGLARNVLLQVKMKAAFRSEQISCCTNNLGNENVISVFSSVKSVYSG